MKAFLISPYSHKNYEEILRRVIIIKCCLEWLFKQNIYAFSSMLQRHNVVQDFTFPNIPEFWLNFGKSYIDSSDIVYVLMLDGWDSAIGVKTEIEYCKQLNKEIKFIKPFYKDGKLEFEFANQ